MRRFLFHADSHGAFEPLQQAIEEVRPEALFLLGDYELVGPLDEQLAGFAGPVHWIHGNHDTEREDWYDYLFDSDHTSLDGQVSIVNGIRVAGLGGVFKKKVWYPGQGEPRYISRESCLAQTGKGNRWRGGLPRNLRSAIFPADWERLAFQQADILILHEPPESHQYGHVALGDLARAMGVSLVVHGHMHEDYEAEIAGGIRVVGLAERGSRLIEW
ncbi:metallophosphoesterase [Guyparkeria sp. 1SP6A2]|nr:metallophosphoesterase [Guyparkeria sp. 1SP6A2]